MHVAVYRIGIRTIDLDVIAVAVVHAGKNTERLRMQAARVQCEDFDGMAVEQDRIGEDHVLRCEAARQHRRRVFWRNRFQRYGQALDLRGKRTALGDRNHAVAASDVKRRACGRSASRSTRVGSRCWHQSAAESIQASMRVKIAEMSGSPGASSRATMSASSASSAVSAWVSGIAL